MRFSKNVILYSIILILSFQGCANDTSTYSGKKIKLEFAGVRDIQNEAWIKIDGIKYTHYSDYDLQFQDSYSLQASKSIYTIQAQENFEPNNPFTIALTLSKNVSYNSKQSDQILARIIPDQAYLLHIAGTLILARPDSSNFNIETPIDYPVKISIIE